MEEIKVNEVFQIGKVKLKCIEGNNSCEGCFFLKTPTLPRAIFYHSVGWNAL